MPVVCVFLLHKNSWQFCKFELLKKHSRHILRLFLTSILCSRNAVALQWPGCVCWSHCGYYFWLAVDVDLVQRLRDCWGSGLEYVCTFLHLCCSVQRIIFNQLYLLVNLVILWSKAHQLGHSHMNVNVKPRHAIPLLNLTLWWKINSNRKRTTHWNTIALDSVVLELRNVRVRVSAQLKWFRIV